MHNTIEKKKVRLTRILSILKGIRDYKKDKAEYERIADKYGEVNADFVQSYGPIG